MVVAVVIIIIIIYSIGKAAGKGPKQKPLPNGGQGIPEGWDPIPSATELHDAMFGNNGYIITGWGTDETKIFATLSNLTPDMAAATENAYNAKYYPKGNGDLVSDLENELSGQDLLTAMSYIK